MPLDFDIITGLNTSNSEILKQDTDQRIADILSIKPNLNSGSVIMPNVPTSVVGNPMNNVNVTPELKVKSAIDSWLTDAGRLDKDFNSGAGQEKSINAKGTERYLDENYGYNTDRDNEDFYAKQQKWYSEIPKALLVKLPALTLAKVGTGLGFLAGLIDPNNWNENFISRAADNGIARSFANLEDNIKNDWLTTFQETSDQGKGFFSRAFTDLNFWTEDVTDGLAFMASAFVPGLGLSKIGAGVKTAELLGELGIAGENGVLGNLGLAKLAGYMKNSQSIANTIDKTLITALNTSSEAMWEAKGVRDSVLDNLKGKMNPTTGQVYTDPEIRAKAGQAAQNTFLANAAILSLSNLWETNLLYKVLGKTEGEGARIGLSALGEEITNAVPKTRFGQFVNSKTGQALLEGVKGIGVEGFYEENAQLATQRLYDGTSKRDNFFEQLLTQTGDAITGNDTEAAMNIGIGGLIGLGGGVTGHVTENWKQQAKDKALLNELNGAQANWMKFGNIYNQNQDGSIQLDDKGNPSINLPKLRTTIDNWSKMTDLKLAMDNTNSPDLHKIIQKEAFSNFVKAHINAGIEGQIQTKLDGLLSLTDQQLVSFGFDPTSNKDRVADVADLKNYANDLIELNESINNDVLYRPSVGESNEAFLARKDQLFKIGARQLALQQQSSKVSRDIDNTRSRMGDSTNPFVDQINYLRQRIESQRSLINQVDNYTLDGSDINIEEERKELANLTKQFNDLKATDPEQFKSLVIKPIQRGNEVYQLPNVDNMLSDSLNRKTQLKAQLDNSAQSMNREFYSIANSKSGADYFLGKQVSRIQSFIDQINADQPINGNEQQSIGGKKATYRMSGQKDVEFEEGKLYVGSLSKTEIATKKGTTATIFNNDKIKIIKINDDGSVLMTINNDAPVTFTKDEIEASPSIIKYDNLSPLQRFYLANRNTVYKYRVPTVYNTQTKKWETGIVSGRLSYDKQNNVLKLAYKIGDKTKYVEFNPKYVVGQFDVKSLSFDQQAAIKEQQDRLDKLKDTQVRLFESLITDTDREIDEQKQRAEDNYNKLLSTQDRLDKLNNDLARQQEEFEQSDKSKVGDKRTKAGRIARVIKTIENEIASVQANIDSLRLEKQDITNRQEALKFMMDEYLAAYDSLLDTNEPVTRGELNFLEHREGELIAQDKGARYNIAQIEDMLANTMIEQEATDIQISNLESYLKDLREILKRMNVESFIATVFDHHPNITDARDFIKERLNDTNVSDSDKAIYRTALNRINRQPSYFYDIRFLINEIKGTVDTLTRARRGNGFLKTRIQQLYDNLDLKQEITDVRSKMDYLHNVFSGLAKAFAKEKAEVFAREEQKQGKTTVVARTIEDAKNIEENKRLFSEFITEPPAPGEMLDEDKTMFWDTDKPVMTPDNNPLFKSADSHFPNNEINPQGYTQRFFKFTSNVSLDGTYYVMPITQDNDTFGIRFNNETYTDDIKFIVVKKVNNEYKAVDIEGNILSAPNSDNIVYSSFYGHPDLISGSDAAKILWARDNFAFKNNITDQQVLQKINEFIQFREDVKRLTKTKGNQYLPVTAKSNGYQNRVPKDTVTNLPQQLSVEGRLTDNNPDWTKVDLIVSTLGGVAGATNIRLKPGRLAIRKNGNVFQVYNRQLSEQDKARITRLLNKLVYTFGRKAEHDTLISTGASMGKEEADSYTKDINTSDLITQYLSSIIYWDRPQSGKDRANNQFQVDRGYLRRGSGSTEVSIPFTPEAFKNGLESLLDGVYHQVANRLINTTNSYNVLDVDPTTNELTYTTYDSYKAYLMGTSDPVIYTNVVENTTDPSTPQVINSYLSVGGIEDRSIKGVTTEAKSTKIAIEPLLMTSLANGNYNIKYTNPKTGIELSVDLTKNGEKLTSTKVTVVSGNVTQEKANSFGQILADVIVDIDNPVYKIDGKEELTGLDRINTWKREGITYNLSKVDLIEKEYDTPPRVQEPPRQAEITITPPVQPIVPDTKPDTNNISAAEWDKYYGTVEGKYEDGKTLASKFYNPLWAAIDGIRTRILNLPSQFITIEQGTDSLKKYGFSDNQITLLKTVHPNNQVLSVVLDDLLKRIAGAENSDSSINNTLDTIAKEFIGREVKLFRDVTGSKPEQVQGQQTEGTTPTVTQSSQDQSLVPPINDLLDSFKGFDENSDDNYDNYRIADKSESDYVKENITETKAWFKSNLPQFNIIDTDYLIDGRAWGQFKNGAIYIYKNAEQGTGFHEAFEGVWSAILAPEQRQSLINEFKTRPNYRALLQPQARVWKGLTEDQLIKETLAEEFRAFVLSDGKSVVTGQGKRNGFFRRLWNFIKSLFGLSEDKQLSIDQLFSNINKGEYANAPILNYDKAVANFKNVPGVSQEVTSQAIEGIAANFFIKLFSKQENTDSLFSKEGNFKLLDDILSEVRSQMANLWNKDILTRAALDTKLFTSVPTSEEDATRMLNNLTQDQHIVLRNKLLEYESTNKFNYKDKLVILHQFKDAVLPIFYDYLRQYGFTIGKSKVSEMDTEDTSNEEIKQDPNYNDPLGIRDSITIDTRNTASTTIKLLIASLTDSEYSKTGIVRYKKNGLGLPKLVDYDKTINTLFNELQGITPVFKGGKKQDILDTMFKSMDSKYQQDGFYKPNFVWLYELKRKLKYIDKSGNRLDTTNLKDEDMRLRVAFIKSFSKSKNNPLKLILADSNNIYSVNPIVSSNTYRIREFWNNNAKASTQKSNDFLKIDNNTVLLNTTSPKFSSLLKSNSLLDKVEMLRGLGITFSVPDNELVQRYQKTFGDAILRINALIQSGEITTFDDLFSKQNVNGPINSLLDIELSNNSENLSLQYRNPAGENEYSIVNPSAMTNVLNSLAGVDNIKDFIQTNPQLGTVNPDGSIILKTYQQGSQLLKLGGILFDNNGNKRKDLTYTLVGGIAQATESDGEVTAKLKRSDKILQELYHMANGTYYTIINSDKSSEFAINMGEFIPMFSFTIGSEIYNPQVRNIYSNHLTDEVNSLIDLANKVGSNIQYYSTNQTTNGKWMLTHFRDIITSQTNINKLQQAIQKKDASSFVNDASVQQEIANYLSDYINRQQQALIKLGIVTRLSDGTYTSKALSKEQMAKLTDNKLNPNSFSQAYFDNLTRYLYINHQIAVREQHKLIYGHPALYKDLPKRSNGATSTKEAIVDSHEINVWLDSNYPRFDGKVRANEDISTFNNVSYSDVNVVSFFYKDIAEGMYKSMINDMSKEQAEKRIGATFNNDGTLKALTLSKGEPTGDIKAYATLNEADAQAYILGDFYHDLLFLSAKLSKGQQNQIMYEFAYERQQRSKKGTDDPSYRQYTPQEVKDGLPKKDADILAQGNLGYVLPVLKPQYFGYSDNPNVMHTVFLKHSVKPLFYRFVEGTSMEQKYIDNQNNQVDIIGYESGEKVGNIYNNNNQFQSFYDDNGKSSSIIPPIQKLYTKFYGIQVEMAAKLKDSVIRGTQMTKIIMSNIFKNGAPVKAEYQQIIDKYNNTLTKLTQLGKQELLIELGLNQEEDGTYTTTNLKKLVSTLRDEAVKRDLPSNIVEAFEASLDTDVKGLVYKFDSFSNRDKIDNILNAIVDSRVISQHMHGKPAVQAAVTGTEKLGVGRKVVYLNNGIYTETSNFDDLSPEEKKTARIASSDLKFYRQENGKTQSMEVYLPHWFKELYGKNVDIDINTLDKRLLTLIGFRIPTQGMNSIDSIIVKGFLNPEEGDTVVVPSEIVGKSGSDFDIDKMNIFIPNYRMVNGNPVYVEDTEDSREGLENRLINTMTELLTLPENYRQLVVPNSVDTLKAIESIILELRGASKSKAIPFTRLSEWDYMNETRERFLVGKQLVGIGALQITNQAITQIANIFLNGQLDGENINIRFPHNVNEQGKLYLSAITDKAGQWISELLSEALSGFVDAAKDPFVFELNMNPATAGTYFYLMRLGVPVQLVALFHTQPAITEYVRNQQANESMLNKINGDEQSKQEIVALTQSDFVKIAYPNLVKDSYNNNSDLRTLQYLASVDKGEPDPYLGWTYPDKSAYRKALRQVSDQIANYNISEYKENDLKNGIRANTQGVLTQDQARYQLVVLSDFLNHQQEANALSTFINAVSYDTARTKNVIENVLQQFNYNKVLDQAFISNPSDVLTKTFLGEMKAQKDEVPKMFQNYFVSLHPNAQAIFQPMYRLLNNPELSMTDDTKKDFLNRYQNFFLNYLLHTVKVVNPLTNNEESLNKYYSLFFGMDSFAHQLRKAQLANPDNKILSELFPIVSTNRSNTDNVKLFTTKLSTYESNSIIESAVNLLEQSQTDPNLRSFVNNLAVFSIIQSGVQVSPISYTKVLPNELYANLVGTIFDKFTDSASNIDPNIVYKQFFQNNYANGTLVPNAKSVQTRNDGIIAVNNALRISRYDFLSRKTEKLNPSTNQPYTYAEKQDIIKNKQWDDLYDRTIYQKFDEDDGNFYYRPVNKLGNRIFATEAYKTDTRTMNKDQIQLSGINDYVNESSYPDTATPSSKNSVAPKNDDELNNTKNNLDC